MVARPAIVGAVPAFIFDASSPGSDKTLQADIVSLIATGRVSGGMGFPADDEELERVLGGYASIVSVPRAELTRGSSGETAVV